MINNIIELLHTQVENIIIERNPGIVRNLSRRGIVRVMIRESKVSNMGDGEYVMAKEGMNGSMGGGWEATQEIDEELRGSRAGAGAQVSMSFPGLSLGDVTARGTKDNGLGLGLGP